jgi:hypothetical protein
MVLISEFNMKNATFADHIKHFLGYFQKRRTEQMKSEINQVKVLNYPLLEYKLNYLPVCIELETVGLMAQSFSYI